MEIRHLKLVKTVAEVGSLTKAGEQLFLSQSALSHQLKEIETELGAELFYRINKKMIPTEIGKRVLASAERILDEMEKVIADVHKYVNGESGTIGISTECYTCYHWLPNVLKQFNCLFPHIEISILPDATRNPIPQLLAGKLDIAIVANCIEEHNNLIYKPLFDDELVLVLPIDHPLRQKAYAEAADFAGEVLLTYSSNYEENYSFQKVLKPAGVVPRKVISVQLTEAIIEMVAAGLGIAVLAKWLITPYLEAGKVSCMRLTRHGLHRTWYAAIINTTYQPNYLHNFISYLKQLKLVS